MIMKTLQNSIMGTIMMKINYVDDIEDAEILRKIEEEQ